MPGCQFPWYDAGIDERSRGSKFAGCFAPRRRPARNWTGGGTGLRCEPDRSRAGNSSRRVFARGGR